MEAVIDGVVSCGLVLSILLVISGMIWQSPPEVRQAKPETSPLYGPVLGALVLMLFVVLGSAILPGVHWDQVGAWLRGEL